MEGLSNIKGSEFAFINKSKKDYMVVKKLLQSTCAIQNEGIACFTEENVQYLRDNSKRQILSFDSDVTGVENSQQITQIFGFDYCNVPRQYLSEDIKDWAELARVKGMATVERIFKEKGLL
jgi:DNA primase